MATVRGLAKVVANAPDWMAHNRKMLCWSTYDGGMVTNAGGCVLEFELETPSIFDANNYES